MSRRRVVKTAALAGTSIVGPAGCSVSGHPGVLRRAVTSGPAHHWFGYYDRWQFGPDDRRLLTNRVRFEHRSPRPDDEIDVGYIDLANDDRWVQLGTSSAWNWQQGCMLQWVPGTEAVVWNDRIGCQFVSRWKDLATGEERVLPRPTYALSPDGRSAVTTDFSRLHALRPGYGYARLYDSAPREALPDDSGLWHVNLETGDVRLLLSVAEVARLGRKSPLAPDAIHYFNVPVFSPDGSRIAFLHRWKEGLKQWWRTRLLTCNPDGSDLFPLIPYGYASHFAWRDSAHICCWTQLPGTERGFYTLRDGSREVEPVGQGIMTRDGHISYLPVGSGKEWILCDTYPDLLRRQTVYLYHMPTRRRVDVAVFWTPYAYRGEWRCDLHPRFSREGNTICVDAPASSGRQLHALDIGAIVG